MKRKVILSIILLLFLGLKSYSQSYKTDQSLITQIDKSLSEAASQYKVMMHDLIPGRFPKTFNTTTGTLETSDSGWWCSGFYPGTLLKIYEEKKDTVLLAEANRVLGTLSKEQFNTGTHDLGFMMFCSFGNALALNPKAEYKKILLNSAKSLSTRFDHKIGCIRSWNSKDNDFIVIIDNMMNLELLFWATRETGDSSFYKIAVTHANTTMKNHYRPDYSSYHVVNYSPQTGVPQKKLTAQGYADESAWARGQAWGLYGFAVMYRETKDPKYLEQANRIAKFLINHPNLPKDKIPYWDFNAPNIPDALRDASAGAITASALLELCRYTTGKLGRSYFDNAEQIIRSLSAAPYKSLPGSSGGFLLQHSVGHFPQKTEVDQPLTYADYYFVEAMQRYKSINKSKL
jgi:unsaturated chondroitin disaccharide hydrolase